MHEPQDAGSYRAELKATGGLVAWTLTWAASLALARFGPGLIPIEVEIAVLPALMGVVFLIAFLIGKIRYR